MAPSPARKTYRVLVYTWDAYKTFLEAATEEQAIAQAEALFDAQGPEAFTWDDSGTDEIVADAVEGGA
jgi:hypothetical protein